MIGSTIVEEPVYAKQANHLNAVFYDVSGRPSTILKCDLFNHCRAMRTVDQLGLSAQAGVGVFDARGWGHDRVGSLLSKHYANAVTNLPRYDSWNQLANAGWAAVAGASVGLEVQMPKSTFNRVQGAVLFLSRWTALLALVLGGLACSKTSPISPIVFGHWAVPMVTNADFVCVTVTNQSDAVVVYLACPVQIRSNEVWSGAPAPYHQRMATLTARQSGVVVVAAAAAKENARVPVLWGFIDYTPGASRWRQIVEDLAARASGRGGVGLLFTNYLTVQRP